MSHSRTPFQEAAVEVVFQSYPQPLRQRLLALREVIFDTAAATGGVGTLHETLKWGQPSYLTPETKSGSTIRIDRVKGSDEVIALYVHCQTRLVTMFRERYPHAFTYEGNRALLLDGNQAIDDAPLRHCVALALTYHQAKRAQVGSAT
ncbi:MAG: DUF1801 domain-containing protein [Pseudomonadota bacterium]